jgi:hypothetical protein
MINEMKTFFQENESRRGDAERKAFLFGVEEVQFPQTNKRGTCRYLPFRSSAFFEFSFFDSKLILALEIVIFDFSTCLKRLWAAGFSEHILPQISHYFSRLCRNGSLRCGHHGFILVVFSSFPWFLWQNLSVIMLALPPSWPALPHDIIRVKYRKKKLLQSLLSSSVSNFRISC